MMATHILMTPSCSGPKEPKRIFSAVRGLNLSFGSSRSDSGHHGICYLSSLRNVSAIAIV
jgi:hypothetical protein